MRRCVAAGVVCLASVALLGWAGTALGEPARPTANPAGASPTAPDPAGPPLGQAPDGSIVGGADLASRGLLAPASAPPLPADITARGWVVADASTGEILAANDAHGRYYPASTLKLLTLLALYPQLDPAQVVTATVEDERVEGSRVGLINGGQYDVRTLWLSLMLQSGNDAANALSRTAGGPQPTLDLMYDTADRLRAYDTSPGGPSGLDVEGQRSSPYDLALLMAAAVADPDLLSIMGTTRAQLPGVPGLDPGFEIQNQNNLLLNYPGALAGKTGFTDAARHTYVAAAERDGRRLVVSLMQAEQVPIPTWEQAARLLDWGFALPAGTPSVGELVAPGSAAAPSTSGSAEPTGAAGQSGIPSSTPATSPAAEGTAGQSSAQGRSTPAALSAASASTGSGSGGLPLVALTFGSAAIVAGTTVGCRRARLPATGRVLRGPSSAQRPRTAQRFRTAKRS